MPFLWLLETYVESAEKQTYDANHASRSETIYGYKRLYSMNIISELMRSDRRKVQMVAQRLTLVFETDASMVVLVRSLLEKPSIHPRE